MVVRGGRVRFEASEGVYGLGSLYRPEVFPGLEIPVDSLWD